MYVDSVKTSAVVFNYLVNNRYGTESKPILLKGLDPQKHYSVKEINVYPGTKSALAGQLVYSGDFLMTVGFDPIVNSNRHSVVLELSEVAGK
jgi:alpha-galactosidase